MIPNQIDGLILERGASMKTEWDTELVEQTVTYALEMGGKVYLVEHVPARIHPETGEQYFSPETVELLQSVLNTDIRPERVIETPVYEFRTLRKTGQ